MRFGELDRRSFLTTTAHGFTGLSLPFVFGRAPLRGLDGHAAADGEIRSTVRPPTLFAGIRKPIRDRTELEPRIREVRAACGDAIAGPLTHIFRFDTPVEGFDSEIGFPVRAAVEVGAVRSHTLRSMHFFSNVHEGSVATLPRTRGLLYEHLNRVGLSSELELVEVFHRHDPDDPENQRIESMASYLPWPEKYREELTRVLGEETTRVVWAGGEKITPDTLVDERCRWVAASIERLKEHSTPEQQFDILSRVALVRPPEEIEKYQRIYDEAGGEIDAVIEAHQEHFLKNGRTEGWLDMPHFDGKVLHVSKVPRDERAYLAATTPEEIRKSFCFCNLVRGAEDPCLDPIFCYRAAGWARQFFEPIMGVEFKRCEITHSILKGDRFCAWDFYLE